MIGKLLKAGALTFAALAAGLWGMKAYMDRDFAEHHDAGAPLQAEAGPVEAVEETKEVFGVTVEQRFRRQAFSYEARPGERVPGLLTLPASGAGPFPAVVFVHGSGQRKHFIEEIATPFNEAGFAMASFDQHMRGTRQVAGNWRQGMAWRERAWKTVADTRRLVDYLETRPDIDPERIYLVGASWGAITGTSVVAQDKRIKAAVLVVGGGDINTMLDAPLIRDNVPRLALALARPVVRYFMGAADPVRHAPRTAPTPVLMQCGSDDQLVSPEAGEALFAALSEPKELRWYPIDHPGIRAGDGPEILRMLDDGLAWIAEQDAALRGVPDAAPAAHASVAGGGTGAAPGV